MISKELLTDLPCLLAVMLKLTSGLVISDLESLSFNRGILILVGVDFIGVLISFAPSWIHCLSFLHLLLL